MQIPEGHPVQYIRCDSVPVLFTMKSLKRFLAKNTQTPSANAIRALDYEIIFRGKQSRKTNEEDDNQSTRQYYVARSVQVRPGTRKAG